MYFGLASIVVAALIIFTQRSYKRLLAYSSIEHMGVIALGHWFGGVSVLWQPCFTCSITRCRKCCSFLASGNILLRFGSTKFENVSGVMRGLADYGRDFFSLGFLGDFWTAAIRYVLF
jgi:hydrogenase-4 component F